METGSLENEFTHMEITLTDIRGLPINPHDTREMLKALGKTEQEFCEWIGHEDMGKTGYAYSVLIALYDLKKYWIDMKTGSK